MREEGESESGRVGKSAGLGVGGWIRGREGWEGG